MATGALSLSGIHHEESLQENLKADCLPVENIEMDVEHYQDFLHMRRLLMAEKLKEYYFGL
ncbi:MAG: hypothetical protein IPO92_18465 [Saprospiraceae bacterium]|nr:hypothetical protein [Saprospiraceae bacterium]